MYGIWSSTLFGSGGAIQWQRWQGTLEVLVSTPAPFILVMLPLTVATSAIGMYSLASTLFWGRLVFGIPFHVHDWLAFVVAVPATILGLGLLGLLFASTFVLYRHANALSNMLEWPVLLVTGMLVPLSLLPGWAHPIAWVLAPTWGVPRDSRGGPRRHALARHRHDGRRSGSSTSCSGRCSSATSRPPPASTRRSRSREQRSSASSSSAA